MRDPAGAPSSSSGTEGPQPMAVEPDPMVRRGLKRATEGNPEISEICSWISDVNANEEPHLQGPVGEFTDEEEWQALSAELAHLDEFDAKKDIPRDHAPGPLLTFTWVRTVKNGAPNFRLCLLLFGRQSERCKESLYCPTLGPQIYRMLLVLAVTVWSVRFFDISRTFLHTPIKTRVFANPPEDYQSPIPGGVSEMTKTVYCLQEAPAEHSLYRTMVGKLMFIAAERPDSQFCVKVCARGVQSPSARDMQRAKRICRYLMGTRD